MKAIIIYKSIHHKNTEKVAKAIAEVLGATLVQPEDVDPASLAGYELIGFGSGIYKGEHHGALLKLANKLPPQNKAVFVFSTCGSQKGAAQHKALLDILTQKGCVVKGEFNCGGWITLGMLRFFGGVKKGHPNEKDLVSARTFAKSLMS